MPRFCHLNIQPVKKSLIFGVFLAVLLLVAIAAPAGGNAAGPVAHIAAVCADFPNQAAAQYAGNTRDANGNGIYCESLPCPCSHAAPGTGTPPTGATPPNTPAPTPPAPPTTTPGLTLGSSVPLAPVKKTSGCHVKGALPDSLCTPGARFSLVTTAEVCVRGYSKNVRNVTTATKNAVYVAYGMTRHFNMATGEVDHLVSLELGGSNDRSNLFPEAATPTPGSHQKDKLENALHSEVCSGKITLATAQHLISTNWVAAYHARF